MRSIRRSIAVAGACIGLAVVAAAPAGAQVAGAQAVPNEARYLQVPTQTFGPVFNNTGPGGVLGNSGAAAPGGVLGNSGGAAPGGVLANSGVRATPATPAVSGQVLPLQVSSGSVAGAAQARAQVQGLAFTGADIAGLVMFGLFAIVVGAVLTRRARPRSIPQN